MNTANLVKKLVVHENYPDDKGNIYCRLDNKIAKFDMDKCYKCPLLSGSSQGNGVECYYEDVIDKHVKTPYRGKPNDEKLRISQLIDLGLVTKEPVRPD